MGTSDTLEYITKTKPISALCKWHCTSEGKADEMHSNTIDFFLYS